MTLIEGVDLTSVFLILFHFNCVRTLLISRIGITEGLLTFLLKYPKIRIITDGTTNEIKRTDHLWNSQ